LEVRIGCQLGIDMIAPRHFGLTKCAVSLTCILMLLLDVAAGQDDEYDEEAEFSAPGVKRGVSNYVHALRIRRGGGASHALRIRKSDPAVFPLELAQRIGRGGSSFQHALRIKKSPSSFALRIKKDLGTEDDDYLGVGRRAALHTLRIKKDSGTGWNGSNRGLFWLNSGNLLSSPEPVSIGASPPVLSNYQQYAPDSNFLKNHIYRDRKSASFSHVLRV